MSQYATMWMHKTLESCCKTNYNWQLATCMGSSGSSGSTNWYMDFNANKCVKDCVGASPCGGLAESWDIKYSTQDKCCSERMWWDKKSCMAWVTRIWKIIERETIFATGNGWDWGYVRCIISSLICNFFDSIWFLWYLYIDLALYQSIICRGEISGKFTSSRPALAKLSLSSFCSLALETTGNCWIRLRPNFTGKMPRAASRAPRGGPRARMVGRWRRRAQTKDK